MTWSVTTASRLTRRSAVAAAQRPTSWASAQPSRSARWLARSLARCRSSTRSAVRSKVSELVIENQYGKADHDHLTRGLAYAVARGARGLIVIAEEHRDEFRAVGEYLNTLAEKDEEHGIAVWLVEVAAVRIGDSAWAPLFTPVVSPNAFVAKVSSTAGHSEDIPASLEEFYKTFTDEQVRGATQQIVIKWLQAGHRYRLGKGHVVLSAEGPAVSGIRTVVAITNDGRVLVPYSSYAGQNSGIPVDALTTDSFRAQTDQLFGFNGSEKQARTAPAWLHPDRVESLMAFCLKVAAAYQEAVQASATVPEPVSSG